MKMKNYFSKFGKEILVATILFYSQNNFFGQGVTKFGNEIVQKKELPLEEKIKNEINRIMQITKERKPTKERGRIKEYKINNETDVITRDDEFYFLSFQGKAPYDKNIELTIIDIFEKEYGLEPMDTYFEGREEMFNVISGRKVVLGESYVTARENLAF